MKIFLGRLGIEMLTRVCVQARSASNVTRVTGSSAWTPAGASPRVSTAVSDDASAAPLPCPLYVQPLRDGQTRDSCPVDEWMDMVLILATPDRLWLQQEDPLPDPLRPQGLPRQQRQRR